MAKLSNSWKRETKTLKFLGSEIFIFFSISIKIVSGVRLNTVPQLHLFKNLYPEGKEVLKCFYSLFSERFIPVSIVFMPVYELAKYKF
jgi:hypothetical protein